MTGDDPDGTLTAPLHDLADAMAPHAETEAELIGLIVGTRLGAITGERDAAMVLADKMAAHLGQACRHLEAVLPFVPTGWAHVEDATTVAAAFLAAISDGTVESSDTPEPKD